MSPLRLFKPTLRTQIRFLMRRPVPSPNKRLLLSQLIRPGRTRPRTIQHGPSGGRRTNLRGGNSPGDRPAGAENKSS